MMAGRPQRPVLQRFPRLLEATKSALNLIATYLNSLRRYVSPETALSHCQLEMLSDHIASTSLGVRLTDVSGSEAEANQYAPGPLIP